MDTGIASSGEESHLISLLSENCEAAEQVALETVTAMDMPVLNSLRELTKGECLHILVSLIIRFLNKLQNSLIVKPLTSPFVIYILDISSTHSDWK
jgi:hypothetical protein